MRTIHDDIIKAFDEVYKIPDARNTRRIITNHTWFEAWKRELRNHDITCDVVNLLDGVPQSTHYHPEFDALMHTFYVCRAVIEMDREDLLETAFLHDVGKGTQTTIGDKRIYHFGHPIASVKFIDQINVKNRLRDYELVRRLTDAHMKYDADHKALKDDKDLADFVKADKVVSKELYKKESDFSDEINNKYKEAMVHLKQKRSKKTLYVMIGIPGSGKSRYLKDVDPRKVVSSDDIRREIFGNVNTHRTQDIPAREVWNIASVRLRVVLELYGEAYLDATNVHKFFRVEFMAPFNDAKKVAVVFDVDEETAIERVRGDIDNGVDRSDVPEKAIRKMYKMFKQGEKSLDNEFNKVIYWKE